MEDALQATISKLDAKLDALRDEIRTDLIAVARHAAPNAPTDQSIGHEEKRKTLHEKVFIPRESLLTKMLSSDLSYRAIYHAMIATLIWLGVKLILQDYSKRGIFIDFGLLTWAFDKFDVVLRVWVAELCISLMVLPLVQSVRSSRNPDAALRLASYIYGALQVGLIAFASYSCLTAVLPPASGLIVMCEAARMGMKMHAYCREKIVHGLRRELQTEFGKYLQDNADKKTPPDASVHSRDVASAVKLLKGLNFFAEYLPSDLARDGVTLASLRSSQPDITIGDWNEEIGRFVFFEFAPTLVYRDIYPRNAGPINWIRAGVHTLNLAGVVLYTYVITRSLLVPLLEPVPQRSVIDIIMLVQGAMVPAFLVFLLSFFGILHSWLNVWAELLRLSDRQFYSRYATPCEAFDCMGLMCYADNILSCAAGGRQHRGRPTTDDGIWWWAISCIRTSTMTSKDWAQIEEQLK
jgi:sterol O-acyltransferase